MFVSRRANGTINGMWFVRQFEGQEELPDNHPDVLAGVVFDPGPTLDELAADVEGLLDSGSGPRISWPKLFKAKVISELAFRLGKPPAQLTAQEFATERDRIAAIYKAL